MARDKVRFAEFINESTLYPDKKDRWFDINKIKPLPKKAFNYDFLSFDTEAFLKPDPEYPDITIHDFNFGYLYNGFGYHFFDNSAKFVEFLEMYNDNIKVLDVYAHNMEYDIQLINPFDAFYKSGYKVTNFNFTGAQFLIMRKGNKIIRFISTTNFFKERLAAIGEIIGMPKLTDLTEDENVFTKKYWDESEANRKNMKKYCRRDTKIVYDVMHFFKELLEAHEMTDVGFTIASTAFRVFRSKFLEFDLKRFRPEEVRASEYAAYYGGRTECFYLGQMTECYYFDINSMYPTVMKDNYYPCKWSETIENESIEQMIYCIEELMFLAVAEVVIETDANFYPYREEKSRKLIFPTGTFCTWLCTPELIIAYRAGDIKEIKKINYYFSRQHMFTDYVEEIYGIRQQYSRAGNEIGKTVFKLMLNSLYGKFGQRNQENILTAETEEFGFRDFFIYEDDEDGNIIEIRMKQIGHDIFEVKRATDESNQSFTAIAAHVTSYARTLLLSYIKEVVEAGGTMYYCDTDSLVVDKIGADALAEYVDDFELGKLKMEYENITMNIYGLKDYEIYLPDKSKKTKMKGIKKKAEQIGETKFRQEHFQKFTGFIKTGKMTSTKVTKEIRKNPYDKGKINENGFVTPFVKG